MWPLRSHSQWQLPGPQRSAPDVSGHTVGNAGRVPATARALCTRFRISCSGHWVGKAYVLATPFMVGARGRIAAAVDWGKMQNEGTRLCMSSFGTHSRGAPAHQWYCNNSGNEYWYLGAIGFAGFQVINGHGDGWCLTNRHGAAYNGNLQTMWPCPSGAVNTELYGLGGGQGIPIHLYPRTRSYRNNGYAVTSEGNRRAGSDIEEWRANPRAPNQQWSGPVRCVPGC